MENTTMDNEVYIDELAIGTLVLVLLTQKNMHPKMHTDRGQTHDL